LNKKDYCTHEATMNLPSIFIGLFLILIVQGTSTLAKYEKWKNNIKNDENALRSISTAKSH
jgi:hypothetical protein